MRGRYDDDDEAALMRRDLGYVRVRKFSSYTYDSG